jgi:hypothetical protein
MRSCRFGKTCLRVPRSPHLRWGMFLFAFWGISRMRYHKPQPSMFSLLCCEESCLLLIKTSEGLFFIVVDEGKTPLTHHPPELYADGWVFVSASASGCCLVVADSASSKTKILSTPYIETTARKV